MQVDKIDRDRIITKMEYKDFINAVFTKSSQEYKYISNKIKESYFYVLCSVIAKHDPHFINRIQSYSHWSVVDMIRNKYAQKYVPSWVYFKATKTTKTKKFLSNYSKEEIRYVLETTQYEYKSFLSLLEKDPKKVRELLLKARKVIKGLVKTSGNKKFSVS